MLKTKNCLYVSVGLSVIVVLFFIFRLAYLLINKEEVPISLIVIMSSNIILGSIVATVIMIRARKIPDDEVIPLKFVIYVILTLLSLGVYVFSHAKAYQEQSMTNTEYTQEVNIESEEIKVD